MANRWPRGPGGIPGRSNKPATAHFYRAVALEGWESHTRSRRQYTLRVVRPGVTWNNGDAFTAEDVAANFHPLVAITHGRRANFTWRPAWAARDSETRPGARRCGIVVVDDMTPGDQTACARHSRDPLAGGMAITPPRGSCPPTTSGRNPLTRTGIGNRRLPGHPSTRSAFRPGWCGRPRPTPTGWRCLSSTRSARSDLGHRPGGPGSPGPRRGVDMTYGGEPWASSSSCSRRSARERVGT